MVLVAALVIATPAMAGEHGRFNGTQHAALNAYSMCWISVFAKLHYSAGLNPAIDAANAACKPQLEAFAATTDRMEAGTAMVSIMRAAKDGGFDNVKQQ
jgi:hypothetical protein